MSLYRLKKDLLVTRVDWPTEKIKGRQYCKRWETDPLPNDAADIILRKDVEFEILHDKHDWAEPGSEQPYKGFCTIRSSDGECFNVEADSLEKARTLVKESK